MVNKIIKLLFIIIASLFVIIPLFFTDFKGGEISETEKRKLALGPLQYKDNITDFKISQWINDNIGLRKEMLKYKTYIEYYIFKKSPSPAVEIGLDGFLFTTFENNMKIASGTYPFDKKQEKQTVKNLLKFRDILEKDNIKFVFNIVPSKVSIYPEYIKYFNYEIRETPSDKLEKLLNNKVNYINTKTSLRKEKERSNDLMWLKTDSHWNQYGVYIGYKDIIDKLKSFSLISDDESYIRVKKNYNYKQRGDLAQIIGLDSIKEETTLGMDLLDNTSIKIEDKPFIKELKEKHKEEIISYSFINKKKTKKILVYADSFFGITRNMPIYLSSHFKEYQHIRGYYLDEEMISSYKPDIIYVEVAERDTTNIVNIFKGFNKNNFIQKAKIYSNNIPKEMKKGKSYSFDIIISNIGEFSIGTDYMNIIGILEENTETNSIISDERLNIENMFIKPGDSLKIHINNFIPNVNNDFEIRVGEENVCWISNGIKIKIIN